MSAIPIVVAFQGRATSGYGNAWEQLVRQTSDELLRLVGVAPSVKSAAPALHIPEPPASTWAIQDRDFAVAEQVRRYLPSAPDGDFYTALILGVEHGGATDGMNSLLGETWFQKDTTWAIAHEWGHMAGLVDLSVGFVDPFMATDTIMAYGSVNKFPDQMTTFFTWSEMDRIRQSRWWDRKAPPLLYPEAEQVPWYMTPQDFNTYVGANDPMIVMLHVAQGWESTIRQWANSAFTGAWWHFTVTLDGRVLQHLNLTTAGRHAPPWNFSSIGIEHEGFSGNRMTTAQAAASKRLTKWLCATLNITYDRWHIKAHADTGDPTRQNDFNIPALRDEHYAFLWQPDLISQPIEQPPEVDVQTRRLSDGEAIGAFNEVAEKFGNILIDDKAEIVTSPTPGEKWYIFKVRA